MRTACICVYCHSAVFYVTEQTPHEVAYAVMKKHDAECPKNPILAKTLELRAVVVKLLENLHHDGGCAKNPCTCSSNRLWAEASTALLPIHTS